MIHQPDPQSPWLTVAQAAAYWQVGKRLIYREAKAGRLKMVTIGARRELRTRREWLDEALDVRAK